MLTPPPDGAGPKTNVRTFRGSLAPYDLEVYRDFGCIEEAALCHAPVPSRRKPRVAEGYFSVGPELLGE